MPSSALKDQYAARYKHLIRKKTDKPPTIPKWANWGWLHLPLATRVQIFSVFFGAVALTTPFWVYVFTDPIGYITFGLWHLCIGDQCTSIHDNLIPGRDVPAWYFMVQGTYTIGTVGSCVCLGILTHNADEGSLKMSPTIHRTCFCLLCITVFQQFLAIYTFISYLDDTDFLYEKIDWELDLHGSFYCAAVALVLTLATTFIVYLDDSITKPKKKAPPMTKERVYIPQEMYYNGVLYEGVYNDGYEPNESEEEYPYPIQRQPHPYQKVHKS